MSLSGTLNACPPIGSFSYVDATCMRPNGPGCNQVRWGRLDSSLPTALRGTPNATRYVRDAIEYVRNATREVKGHNQIRKGCNQVRWRRNEVC